MPVLPRRPAVNPPQTTYPLGPLHAVTLAEALDEYRGRYGGEWRIEPKEPDYWANPGGWVNGDMNFPTTPAIGRLRYTEGRWGTDLSGYYGIVFEYGTARGNVASYTFNVDRQQVANRVYVPRVGWPEPGRSGTTPLIYVDSTDSQTAMGAKYDAWVDPGEVSQTAQRQALADFHLNLRQGPRRIVTFTPAMNAEHEPWVDYNLGDYVRFRAFDGSTLRLDALVRIYGITASIDNQGNESVSLTTQEEATS